MVNPVLDGQASESGHGEESADGSPHPKDGKSDNIVTQSNTEPAKELYLGKERDINQHKFVFGTYEQMQEKAAIQQQLPPHRTSSAKERFSRHIRSITDCEAARRNPSSAAAAADQPISTREEGELNPEVGNLVSYKIAPCGKDVTPSSPILYRSKLRSHSAPPTERERVCAATRSVRSVIPIPLPQRRPRNRGRARNRIQIPEHNEGDTMGKDSTSGSQTFTGRHSPNLHLHLSTASHPHPQPSPVTTHISDTHVYMAGGQTPSVGEGKGEQQREDSHTSDDPGEEFFTGDEDEGEKPPMFRTPNPPHDGTMVREGAHFATHTEARTHPSTPHRVMPDQESTHRDTTHSSVPYPDLSPGLFETQPSPPGETQRVFYDLDPYPITHSSHDREEEPPRGSPNDEEHGTTPGIEASKEERGENGHKDLIDDDLIDEIDESIVNKSQSPSQSHLDRLDDTNKSHSLSPSHSHLSVPSPLPSQSQTTLAGNQDPVLVNHRVGNTTAPHPAAETEKEEDDEISYHPSSASPAASPIPPHHSPHHTTPHPPQLSGDTREVLTSLKGINGTDRSPLDQGLALTPTLATERAGGAGTYIETTPTRTTLPMLGEARAIQDSKKNSNRHSRRDGRDNAPQRSNYNDRDFGRTRPSQDHGGTTYYNTNHRRVDHGDGWDNPSADRRRDRNVPNYGDRDGDRERKLADLQRELDRLKRH